MACRRKTLPHFCRQEPVLIRCEGVVASAPVVLPPRENPFNVDLPPESSTRFKLDVETLNVATGQRKVPASCS